MNQDNNTAREAILQRIRSGLAAAPLPAPFPETGTALNDLYHTAGTSLEEQFAAAFNALGGRFCFCADEQELAAQLVQVCDDQDWRQVLCSDPAMHTMLQQHGIDFVQPASAQLGGADACITPCTLLSARTGSAFFTSAEPMGRVGPVYFPVHIIIAYARQLVPDIDAGLAALTAAGNVPSMINLNTGPSRTADIEKTLVVGVHGPREVWCFLVGK